MNQKQRIEDLERRVRELEARPVYIPYQPYAPLPQYPTPYYPPSPWWNPYGTTFGGGSAGPESVSIPTVWVTEISQNADEVVWRQQ